MILLLENAMIPASLSEPPECVAVNPSSVIPSAFNTIALQPPPASTTGVPLPASMRPLK